MDQNREIYFARSIRGGNDDKSFYPIIVKMLENYGIILTEEFGNPDFEEEKRPDKEIHDGDIDMIEKCNVLVAEVTQVSLGVGYELGRAVAMGKKILCLYRPQPDKKLSAMVRGAANDKVVVKDYSDEDELKAILEEYFRE